MNEQINHYGGLTVRVLNGAGTLIPTFYNFDKSKSFVPNTINLNNSGANELFKLANFKSQRTILRLETDNKNDTFHISRLIIWYKPLWTSLPG